MPLKNPYLVRLICGHGPIFLDNFTEKKKDFANNDQKQKLKNFLFLNKIPKTAPLQSRK